MTDWLTILVALIIIAVLVGVFGFLATKINVSDPLTFTKTDEQNSSVDYNSEKKKGQDQSKKKRKDQKKPKRENKDEDVKQKAKSKEPSAQTSEETDEERDESEQDFAAVQAAAAAEASSKARKRNKNKPVAPAPTSTSTEKNAVTARAPPVTHPKSTTKDEAGSNKQQSKGQVKSAQSSTKSSAPLASASSTTTKKTAPAVTTNQIVEEELPFTVVGGNRNKNGTSTPPGQQQNKTPATNTTSAAVTTPSTVQVQHEPLVQRQPLPAKETTTQVNGLPTNALPNKQQQPVSSAPMKLADLVKILPSSQVVVTELITALDASPLSTGELDIIMRKIVNKQAVINQDWSKLQLGQKVDPQVQIGQAMDESSKAYQEDLKNNSMKRMKELTDELQKEKRRVNDLTREKSDKEREIQILHAQLDSAQHKQPVSNVQQQQHQNQTLQLQLQRVTEETIHLRQQLTQQQELATAHVSNNADTGNVQLRVMSEHMKKLSVDNASLDKKASRFESLAEEAQKQKDDLIRYNEQLTQSLEKIQKGLQQNEQKLHETQAAFRKEANEYKQRIDQLEKDNEQLRREEIVHVEPTLATDVQTITLNSEERDQLEEQVRQLKQNNDSVQQRLEEKERQKHQWTEELEQSKKKYEDLQAQRQAKESELHQEIDRLKQDANQTQQRNDEALQHELTAKNAQVESLRAEVDELKTKYASTTNQSDEHRRLLSDLLPQNVRQQLSHDNQDFNKWLSSYRNTFESYLESNKKTWQDESATLKRENDQLHKNMTDVENQLKEIEQTVRTKEESLLNELKSKDAILGNIRSENEQLNGELHRLRSEIERVQSAHDASTHEARALKVQLDERFLVAANTPPVVADESFELIKQPSPSLSPIVIDIRAEELNELIRSSKEALENQDSLTQQLDRHLDDMHRSGSGETATSHADGTNLSSSDQQHNQS